MTSPSKKQYEIQMETMQKECHVHLERVNFEDLHCNNPVVDPLDIQNASQASSCDYNFAQFRTDEPNFVIKEEASDSETGEKPVVRVCVGNVSISLIVSLIVGRKRKSRGQTVRGVGRGDAFGELLDFYFRSCPFLLNYFSLSVQT